jgi:hypothetical protein
MQDDCFAGSICRLPVGSLMSLQSHFPFLDTQKGTAQGTGTMHRWFQDEVAIGDWLRAPRLEPEGSSGTNEITSRFGAMLKAAPREGE